jgi:hypothetical protein
MAARKSHDGSVLRTLVMLLWAAPGLAQPTPLARELYNLSVSARFERVPDEEFAYRCAKRPECAGDCQATLEWLGDRNKKRISLAAFTKEGEPPPAPRPKTLCGDATHVPEAKLGEWARKRMLSLADRALSAARGEDADRLLCAFGRFEHRAGGAAACKRVEPHLAVEMMHELAPVDESMRLILLLKGCEELAGCAGDCRLELLNLAGLSPKRLPRNPRCPELAQRAAETPDAWHERAQAGGLVHVLRFYAALRLSLDEKGRTALDCDIYHAGFGPPPPGLSCLFR